MRRRADHSRSFFRRVQSAIKPPELHASLQAMASVDVWMFPMRHVLPAFFLALSLLLTGTLEARGQSPGITRDYVVGEWVTRNDEHGRDVEIFWTVRAEGSLGYRFVVDGVSSLGDPGTWMLDGDTLTEVWQRPFGATGRGIARLERIDDNTMRLTIIDNGHPEYTGKERIYRRRTGPQVS